jgi:hypothetical protein
MNELRVNSAGLVTLLILVGLAVLGIARGLSSPDSLVRSGGIQQANDLHVDWVCSWTNDDEVQTDCGDFGDEPAADDGLDPHGSFADAPYNFPYASPFFEKDVGSCTTTIPPVSPDPDTETAMVDIAVAYPSYEFTFSMVFQNTSMVPFTIGGYTSDVSPPLELLNGTCTTTEENPNGSVDENEMASITCTVHIMQEAEQGAQYSFMIEACSGACEGSIIQRAAFYRSLQAPAEISFRVASERR